MAPAVTAVIVTYNNRELVLGQLDRVLSLEPVRPERVIVVDNASSDGTGDALASRWEKDGRLVLIRQEENRGGAGGFRRGVEEALGRGAELIWLLDDDAEPREDALAALVGAVAVLEDKGRPWGALASLIAQKENPLLVTETGGSIGWFNAKLTALNQGRPIIDIDPEPFMVPHGAAASLLTKGSVVKKCGFFEDIFIHLDDVEWCHRISRAGYPVWCVPRSVVQHPFKKGESPRDTPGWIRYYDARNILLLYRRHRPLLLPLAWLRFRFMALAFALMGEGETARLIRLGQKDFFARRLRLRKDL